MGKQIRFYEKNFLDFDYGDASITASVGGEFAKFMRSRSLRSAWMTTNSNDAEVVTIDVDLGNVFLIDRIFLVDHNFKNFTIELYDFETGVWSEIYSITDETKSTSEITFAEFYGQKLRITIDGTQAPDSDKRCNRILITKCLGIFKHWPIIEAATIDQGKVVKKTLSNRSAILRTVGVFTCKLKIENWKNAADIALIEKLYRQVQGFQVWISGGDETQFFYAPEGYREKDIYLVGITNDWQPNFKEGIYVNGLKVELDLSEVVR